jgi:hypothetical protein
MEPLPGVCSRIPVNGLGMSCTLQVRSIALDQVSCTERLGGVQNDEWIQVLTSAISGDRCGLVGPKWGERSRAPLVVSANDARKGASSSTASAIGTPLGGVTTDAATVGAIPPIGFRGTGGVAGPFRWSGWLPTRPPPGWSLGRRPRHSPGRGTPASRDRRISRDAVAEWSVSSSAWGRPCEAFRSEDRSARVRRARIAHVPRDGGSRRPRLPLTRK